MWFSFSQYSTFTLIEGNNFSVVNEIVKLENYSATFDEKVHNQADY